MARYPPPDVTLRRLLLDAEGEAEGRLSVQRYRARLMFPATAMRLGWPAPRCRTLPSDAGTGYSPK